MAYDLRTKIRDLLDDYEEALDKKDSPGLLDKLGFPTRLIGFSQESHIEQFTVLIKDMVDDAFQTGLKAGLQSLFENDEIQDIRILRPELLHDHGRLAQALHETYWQILEERTEAPSPIESAWRLADQLYRETLAEACKRVICQRLNGEDT